MQCGLSMGNMEYMNEVTEEDGEQRFVCACREVWNNTCSMHNADCIMHHLEHGM